MRTSVSAEGSGTGGQPEVGVPVLRVRGSALLVDRGREKRIRKQPELVLTEAG